MSEFNFEPSHGGVSSPLTDNVEPQGSHATIFTKPNCPYCVKAKALLSKHYISYHELSAVEHRDPLIEMVTEVTGQAPKSVPQIFIDGSYVGGHDQLVIWLQERENAVRSNEG